MPFSSGPSSSPAKERWVTRNQTMWFRPTTSKRSPSPSPCTHSLNPSECSAVQCNGTHHLHLDGMAVSRWNGGFTMERRFHDGTAVSRWNGGFTIERRFRDAKPPHLDGLQRTSSAHWTVCGLSRARECVDGNATQRNGIARARLERVRCAAAARLHLDQLVRRRHLRHRAASSRRRDAHGRASISTSSCDRRHL